ncbi:MAG: zf-HC2 domain-containing protein [Pyrinomonadaceae bacterium]
MFSRSTCARAAQWLPLYATGDLNERQVRFVALHLRTCADCRRLAEEFDASQSWIKGTNAGDEFDEQFYARIRGAVLAQIERDTRPVPAAPRQPFGRQLSAMFFGRRFAFAATVAAVALFAFVLASQVLFRPVAGPNQETVNTTPDDVSPPGLLVLSQLPERETKQPERAELPPRNLSSDSNNRELVKRRMRVPDGKPPAPLGESANQFKGRFEVARAEIVRAPSQDAAESPVATAQAMANDAAADGMKEPAKEFSRIEFQTADPNVRIIWLMPKAVGPAGPNRTDHR